MKKRITILGTEYKLFIKNETEEPRLKDVWGFCDYLAKEICIRDDIDKETEESCKNLISFKKKVVRHEIIHAFLFESGLKENAKSSASWAENEEMVDWIAIQFPKLLKIYKELDIVGD
jgi:hypothetical protein